MQLISLSLSSSHSARTSKQYPGSNQQQTSALMMPSVGCGKPSGGFFDEGIIRQYIGTGCTRSEDNFFKVFNIDSYQKANGIIHRSYQMMNLHFILTKEILFRGQTSCTFFPCVPGTSLFY